MLKQFRRQFPQGSFTSELLMVDHGLYLVRSLIQVEGVILSSGLAAASKLEEAEDQARLRALDHLALEQLEQIIPAPTTVSASLPSPVTIPAVDLVSEKIAVNFPTETAVSHSVREEPVVSLPEPEPIIEIVAEPTPPPTPKKQRAAKVVEAPKLEIIPEPISKIEKIVEVPEAAIAPPVVESSEKLELIETFIPEAVTLPQLELIPEPEPSLFPEVTESLEPEIISPSPVSPPLPLSLEPTLTLKSETHPSPISPEPTLTLAPQIPESSSSAEPEVAAPLLDANQPIDFSEVIARSNVELKRLNWTNDQGKNYLLQTYGKRSRQLLSDEELLEFVLYLEAQPNPN